MNELTTSVSKMGKTAFKNLRLMKGKTLSVLAAHSPEILTGLSIAGLATTVVLTAKASVKIDRKIQEKEELLERKLTSTEKLKECWTDLVPPAISTVATGACIMANHQVNESRRAALMTAYTFAEEKLAAYQDKVKEAVGEEVENHIHDDAISEMASDEPDMIIETRYGRTLCYDPMSGRYFRSDMEAIRRAQNDLNEQIIGDWSATLNEWYGFLGLSSIKLGEDLGWNSNNMLRVTFSSSLTSGGEPMLVLDYEVYPEYRLL